MPIRSSTSIVRPFLALLLATFVAVAVFAGWFLSRHAAVHETTTRLSHNLEQTIALNQRLRRGMDKQLALVERFVETPDSGLQESFAALDFELADAVIRHLALDIDLDERVAVEHIRSVHSATGLRASRVFEFTKVDEFDAAARSMFEIEGLRYRLDDEFERLNSLQARKLRELAQVSEAGPGTVVLAAGVLFVVLALSVVFALLRQRVLRPLDTLLSAQSQIREGNLSARSPVKRSDEFGRVAQGFNHMADSLAESYASQESKIEDRTRELRDVHARLIQSEKMSAVGQLVSGVAHELNNPLTSIMGFAELTRESLADSEPNSPEVHNLDVIAQECERCGKIVANLLQFVRKQDTQLEPIRLEEVVETAVDLRAYELQSRGIEIETRFDGTEPVVLADPLKLQQVVLILLNNAVDAIRDGGNSGTIQIELSRAQDRAHLTVRDNGTGFVDPGRALDPFYTTKQPGKGTGLGLSVCYGIVQEHKGDVRAGNWDRGAEVVVSLPLSGERPPIGRRSDEAKEAKPRILSSAKALIVDDEEYVINLQVQLLDQIGVEAEGVANGDQAVNYLQTHSVDIVISDVRMPGTIDGIGLYRWILDHRPDLGEKFVLTTGDAVGLEGVLPKELSARCVNKPFNGRDYHRAIRRVLDVDRTLS